MCEEGKVIKKKTIPPNDKKNKKGGGGGEWSMHSRLQYALFFVTVLCFTEPKRKAAIVRSSNTQQKRISCI